MDPYEIQRLIAEKSKQLGQRASQVPQNINTATDPTLTSIRNQSTDKVRELWEHDKRLADTYANPQSGSYLADPYAREKARATQAQATVGEIGDLNKRGTERKSALEDEYAKAINLFKLGTDISQNEITSLSSLLGNTIDLKKLEAEQQKDKSKMSLLDIMAGKKAAKLPATLKKGTAKSANELMKIWGEVSDEDKKYYTIKTTSGKNGINYEISRNDTPEPEQDSSMGDMSPEMLQYLQQFPDMDEKLAEKYITDNMFPQKETAAETKKKLDDQTKGDDIAGLLDLMDTYIVKRKDTNYFDRINPFSVKGRSADTTRKLLGATITRMFEKGVLSDADRAFYNSLLGDAQDPSSVTESSVQAVKDYLTRRYSNLPGVGQAVGQSSSEKGSLEDYEE